MQLSCRLADLERYHFVFGTAFDPLWIGLGPLKGARNWPLHHPLSYSIAHQIPPVKCLPFSGVLKLQDDDGLFGIGFDVVTIGVALVERHGVPEPSFEDDFDVGDGFVAGQF